MASLGRVLVLKPHGDRREGGVVPGLAVSKPSSNSPIRFAASSATRLTSRAVASSSLAAGAQQRGRREVVADPDGFEVRGEEQPTGPSTLSRLGYCNRSGRTPENLGGPCAARVIAVQRRQRRQVRSALCEPQCCSEPNDGRAAPREILPHRGQRCSVGFHGSNTKRACPRGTAAVVEKSASIRHGGRRQQRRRSLGEVREQRRQIRAARISSRRGRAPPPSPCADPFKRPPHREDRRHRRRARQRWRARDLPRDEKHRASAPDPAAFPPSGTRGLKRSRARPFRACAFPDRASADGSSFSKAAPPRGRHSRPQRLRHRGGHVFHRAQRARDADRRARTRPSPCDRRARDAHRPCSTARSDARARRERRIERDRLDPDVRIAELSC